MIRLFIAGWRSWSERMAFQKKQEELYKSAMQKKREALRLRLKENFNRTAKEQDAVDYFNGRGIYAEYQDIRTKPNIFDLLPPPREIQTCSITI